MKRFYGFNFEGANEQAGDMKTGLRRFRYRGHALGLLHGLDQFHLLIFLVYLNQYRWPILQIVLIVAKTNTLIEVYQDVFWS